MTENILTYSLGSLFLGICISVVCVTLLLVFIKYLNKNSFFNLVSYITAGILFLVLAYNCMGVCGALAMKSDIDFIEETVSQIINLSIPDYNSNFDQEVSSDIIRQVLKVNPILNCFFDSTDLEKCSIADLPHIIASQLYDYLNSIIIKKILWSVAFIIIVAFIIVKTMENRGSSRYRSTSSCYSSGRISSRNNRIVARRR